MAAGNSGTAGLSANRKNDSGNTNSLNASSTGAGIPLHYQPSDAGHLKRHSLAVNMIASSTGGHSFLKTGIRGSKVGSIA